MIDSKDIELLLELTTLFKKHGHKKIVDLIKLLNEPESVKKIVSILNQAEQLVKQESKNKELKPTGNSNIEGLDENDLIIGKINKLLKDRIIFKKVQDIDSFLFRYIDKDKLPKQKSEKLIFFNYYLKKLNNVSLTKLYEDLLSIVQERKSNLQTNNDDLSKWSDIIIKQGNNNRET